MNIYVGNLSYDVTDETLHGTFESFGEVTSAKVIKDKYTGQSRGFAFVEMPGQTQAQTAIKNLNGKELQGKDMKVRRHVRVPVEQDPGEDEWKIIAAGTVTNPFLAEKRRIHGTAKNTRQKAEDSPRRVEHKSDPNPHDQCGAIHRVTDDCITDGWRLPFVPPRLES